MKDASRAWVEAGIVLAENKDAHVPCPNCGFEYLIVEDHAHAPGSTMFDRYLRCDKCGAQEIISRLRQLE